MKYIGLVLEESLKDKSVLDSVTVTKTETWNVGNAEGDQPKVWHAISIEGPQTKASEIAERAVKLALHAGRKTVKASDIKLAAKEQQT